MMPDSHYTSMVMPPVTSCHHTERPQQSLGFLTPLPPKK